MTSAFIKPLHLPFDQRQHLIQAVRLQNELVDFIQFDLILVPAEDMRQPRLIICPKLGF